MSSRGKLNKRDMAALNKAWDILNKWTEWAENEGMNDVEVSGWQFDTAMSAVVGLREFIDSYEVNQ